MTARLPLVSSQIVIESRYKQYSTNMPANLDSMHNNSIVCLTKQTSKS